jgi:hypothetical protein
MNDGNDTLLLNNLINNLLWQIELHTSQDHDTRLSLKPNENETRCEFDCQYGLNIMAAAKILKNNKISFFGFKPFSIYTRKKYKTQKEYSKTQGLSGPDVFEDETWRTLNITNFIDKFLDMFLKNHITDVNYTKTKMLISLYLDYFLKNIDIELDNNRKTTESMETQFNIFKKTNNVQQLNTIQDQINDTKKEYINLYEEKTRLEEAKSKIEVKQITFSDFIFSGDELSRIYDFMVIFLQIIIYEETYISNLKYLFQYLIMFEYAIYQLPSCRILEDDNFSFKSPIVEQKDAFINQEEFNKAKSFIGYNRGGTKTKKRKYNNKRKSKKIKKYKLRSIIYNS